MDACCSLVYGTATAEGWDAAATAVVSDASGELVKLLGDCLSEGRFFITSPTC